MLATLLALHLAITATGLPYPDYGASELQKKVDLSFSPIPIDTPFKRVEERLTKTHCYQDSECEYFDDAGVRHTFWGEFDDNPLVLKILDARAIAGKPISALGIGLARDKNDVLRAVEMFDARIDLDCDASMVSGNVGPQECGADLGPGWIQIGFDERDQLTTIRFDGYHFT